jgi:hypothetical protein
MNQMTNTASSPTPDFKTALNQLDSFLELWLVKKAPGLPENVKELIVKYSPYIALILMIFSLPVILVALGLGALVSPFAFMGGVRSGLSFSLTSLILLAALVLNAIALPGLFARKASAWRLVYYAVLVNAIYSLFTFNLGSLIINTAISLYFLFQIKNYYK